jgi:SAM-dependent methyltransferase
MNTQVHNWGNKVKEKHPQYFVDNKVIEIGSANINGSLRELFTGGEYIGLDVAPYAGVDVVSIAHEYTDKPDGYFDVVFSTSALEHDMFWEKTLRKMVDLLRQGGLMFISVASTWPEHGCSRHCPEHSLTTKINQEWADYYRNITAGDLAGVIDLNKEFLDWEMTLDSGMDLTFIGLKR